MKKKMALDESTSTQNADPTEISDVLMRSTEDILRTCNQITQKWHDCHFIVSMCDFQVLLTKLETQICQVAHDPSLKKKWYENIYHSLKLT